MRSRTIPDPDTIDWGHPILKTIDSLLGPASMNEVFRELREAGFVVEEEDE
jgi:hypothetical protein